LQEDIERRTVALSVNATKLTGRALAKILAAAMRKVQKNYRNGQTPQGRQSAKKLMNHGGSTKSIDLFGDSKLFDRVAGNTMQTMLFIRPGQISICWFFKAGQADAITSCFGEYSKLVLNRGKSRRPSILEQLKTFADQERTKPRQRARKREAVRNER